MERIILHIDMDAFFAAIEERDNPLLHGKPVVIGADPKGGGGRGVVSTANYVARRFGIHSGMPISVAYTLCPDATFLPVDGKKYALVSDRIMKIVKETARQHLHKFLFEQVSIDEAYIEAQNANCTMQNCRDGSEHAVHIAEGIKKKIFDQESLTCSVGIGPNKLIAKIASEEKKPNGLMMIHPEEAQAFLDPKSVRTLHGVGPKTEERLNLLKVKTVADLRAWASEATTKEFGKFGYDLYRMARGIDNRPVTEHHETKSIGRQTTFPEDTRNRGAILKTLIELACDVHKELVAGNFLFKTVTVVIRYRGFETHTHAKTLTNHTQNFSTLKAQLIKLALTPTGVRPVRLVGLRVSGLTLTARGRA